MGTWFEPGDPWPEHPKSWWRGALERARGAGWILHHLNGHNWGKVMCRREPVDDRCECLIFSTGEGGESVAIDFPKMLDRCRHHGSDDAADPAASEAAAQHISDAKRLLGALDKLAAAGTLDDRASELIGLIVEKLELGIDTLELELTVADIEEERDALRNEAVIEAYEREPTPDGATFAAILAAAEHTTTVARDRAAAVSSTTERLRLLDEIGELVQRIDRLKGKT